MATHRSIALIPCFGILLYVLHQKITTAMDMQIDPPTFSPAASSARQAHPRLFMRQSDPLPPRINGTLRLVILSDTHGRHEDIPLPLPEGDVLFHLGDACDRGNRGQMRAFVEWMKNHSNHRERIVIDGNHDRDLHSDQDFMAEYEGVARVLRNELVEIAGGRLIVAGLTWVACRDENFADLKSGIQSAGVGKKRVDLLLSHFPPYVKGGGRGWHGSSELSKFVAKDVSPSLHCFGHVHAARGVRASKEAITMVNCASTWGDPVVVDYCPTRKRVLAIHCPVPNWSLDANVGSRKFPNHWLASRSERYT